MGPVIFVVASTGKFDALVEACDRLADRYEFVGQIGSGAFNPSFPHYRAASPERIEADAARAEIVVSHGGSGTLSLLYRLRKPCVVVPRQTRYGAPNDEQVPVARKWAELGMAVLCMDVVELEAAIASCRSRAFSYPEFPALGDAIRPLLLEPVPHAPSRA